MIDIHSHLIYKVDDGSKSIEDSIEMIKNLENNGVTDIILTPHYIKETNYVNDKISNLHIMHNLKKELKEKGINVNLYLGNEVYIDDDIFNLVKSNTISTLNNSRYILIELPMSGIYPDYIEIFKDLIDIGFKVVLAHPERYISFQNDYNKVLELTDIGILLQCNIGSILGEYGSKAKKTIKLILKDKLVSFVGTDIHNTKYDYNRVNKAKNKFKKYLSEEEIENIFINNPKEIIK